MTQRLTGLTIMVTRPRPEGENLARLLEQNGATAIYFPTIEIAPAPDHDLLTRQIAKLDTFAWLIFVSQHAVYQIAPLIHAQWPIIPAKVQIAAVGASTAKVLQTMQLPVTVYPTEDWRSEALLALPELQNVSGKTIALVRGEGGRELLAEELTQRGAKVTSLVAYRRCLPTVDIASYADLLAAGNVAAIVCASGETLQNLKLLFDDANWPMLCKVPVVIASARMAAIARELGFKTIFLAKNASHDAMIEILARKKGELCQTKYQN